MASNASKKELNIIFIGDTNVGKTSIFKLFENHEAFKRPIPTIGIQTIERHIVIGPPEESETVTLWISDTGGQERFMALTPQFYRADIAFLVYSITDRRSFEHIADWMKELADINHGKTQMILIGNKNDQNDERVNPLSKCKQYAWQNNMRFIEMSALNDDDFRKFYDVLKETVTEVIAKGGGIKESTGLNLEQSGRHGSNEPRRRCSKCSLLG